MNNIICDAFSCSAVNSTANSGLEKESPKEQKNNNGLALIVSVIVSSIGTVAGVVWWVVKRSSSGGCCNRPTIINNFYEPNRISQNPNDNDARAVVGLSSIKVEVSVGE